MKKLLLVSMVLLSGTGGLFAQSFKGLRLGALVGLQGNRFGAGFGTQLSSTHRSFTQGAAASFLTGNFIIGGEFYQSSGTREQGPESIQLTGSNMSLVVGYCPFRTSSFRLETTLGLGISSNQIIAGRSDSKDFENLVNNQFSLNPGIAAYINNRSNLTWGIRLFYDIGVNGNTAWKYKVNDTDSIFQSNVNAFVIQFTMGGIIRFDKE